MRARGTHLCTKDSKRAGRREKGCVLVQRNGNPSHCCLCLQPNPTQPAIKSILLFPPQGHWDRSKQSGLPPSSRRQAAFTYSSDGDMIHRSALSVLRRRHTAKGTQHTQQASSTQQHTPADGSDPLACSEKRQPTADDAAEACCVLHAMPKQTLITDTHAHCH